MMISKTNDKARTDLYRLLSRLYRVELDQPLLDRLKCLSFPTGDASRPLAEGYAMLRTYLNACNSQTLDDLAVEFATVFLAAGSADGSAAIPCESLYTSPKKIFMQENWQEVTRLYAKKGLSKADAVHGLPKGLMEDHLALELEFMAWLVECGSVDEQRSFLSSHLLNWVPAFAADIDRYAQVDFYKAVGRITLGFLELELCFLDELADPDSPLRMAPSYSVRADRMAPIFTTLQKRFRIYGPRYFAGRGPKGEDLIRYGELDQISDLAHGVKSNFSPKEVFYPVSQTMFHFWADQWTEKTLEDTRGILLFARPCDINAIRRLDQMFLRNGSPDLYYQRMRSKLTLVLLECRESFENCFCVSMGTNWTDDYSAAVRIDDICALVEVTDPLLLPYFEQEVPIRFTPEFVTENARAATLPVIASRQALGEVCKLDYWKQYDETCIACGGCNTVCPTCTCFDTVDILYDETSRDGERRRVWSACMLRDFTQTAGGSMARKTQGANMRFKVLHKMYDYNLRFGGAEHMCVGCGRCVDRCPQGIDYLDVVNNLSLALEQRSTADEKEAH